MTRKILCIEDNPDNLLLVRRVMESLGFKFLGAQTGELGLTMAKEVLPDLILLDINLPDIDGYEVARRMRASDETWLTRVPIIAVTANALKGDADKALSAGCDVYMSKPINIHELWDRVDSILGSSDDPKPDI